MKNLFCGSVALIALAAAGSAVAADMPAKAPVYKAPPLIVAYNWTGFYIGAQGGLVWGKASHSYSNGAPSTTADLDGFVGGGHAGYNFQSGNIVFGIEGDVEAGDVNGSFSNLTGMTSVGSTKLNSQWSVRGRLGFAAGNTLFYLTGGWASGDFDFTGGPAPGPACCGYSQTLHGWTAGGGAEVGFAPNMTVRIEYRYTDFGSASGGLPPIFPDVIMPVDVSTHALRFGLSYKWGDFGKGPVGKGPLVTRY